MTDPNPTRARTFSPARDLADINLTKEKDMDKLTPIGEVYVDAGCVVIGDPAHLFDQGLVHEALEGRTPIEAAGEILKEGRQHSPFVMGVLAFTPHGDGRYPVLAELDEDGYVKRLVVELDR